MYIYMHTTKHAKLLTCIIASFVYIHFTGVTGVKLFNFNVLLILGIFLFFENTYNIKMFHIYLFIYILANIERLQ